MNRFKLFTILVLLTFYNSFGQHTVTIKKGDDKNFTYFTIQGDTTKFKFKATVADYEGRFEDAANYTVKAIENGEFKPEKIQNGYYDAACYFTLVQKSDKAIRFLLESINSGWEDLAKLEYDPDLQLLKQTEEWRTKIEPALDDYYRTNNRALAKMFAEDQKPRLNGQMDSNLVKQDSIRREQIQIMIKNNELKSGHDYYKAAMIMHHGNTVEDYMIAEKLTQKSLTAQRVHHMSPWLSAAIKDRLLLKQGKPQWYGTQNMTVVNGKIAMDPKTIDTTAVSAEKRKELNAPTIETLREYIKNFKSK